MENFRRAVDIIEAGSDIIERTNCEWRQEGRLGQRPLPDDERPEAREREGGEGETIEAERESNVFSGRAASALTHSSPRLDARFQAAFHSRWPRQLFVVFVAQPAIHAFALLKRAFLI
jgi:hypothetical protein